MPASYLQSRPWSSLIVALPAALGVPLLCLQLWSMAITANSNWRGGMFYFPTTFLETVCLLAFIASAFPFFLTIVIGVGFIIPLLHSIGLGHQQLIVPTTGTPMTLTLDFVLVTCLAGSVQVVAWMIAIERIRSKRTSRNQSHFSG